MHGGNLTELSLLSSKHGGKYATCEVLDFSGNINPIPIPQRIKDVVIDNLDIMSHYPDLKYTKLRKAISNYCNCDENNVIVGNGSTEIISLFIEKFANKKVLIVSPVYSEFERELIKNNCEIVKFALKEENDFDLDVDELLTTIDSSIELLILCNPNNPTGNALDSSQIERILKNTKFVMIDESYAEFTEDVENINATPLTGVYDNLFVIRGTSKFFSMAGLRLGYAICGNMRIISEINDSKDLWSVNCFADLIGQILFEDDDFIKSSKNFVYNERIRVIKELSKIVNLKVYNSKSNFILCKIIDSKITSEILFNKLLLDNNIAIRDAKDFEFLDETFFRFCLLSKENNNLLIDKLNLIFSKSSSIGEA